MEAPKTEELKFKMIATAGGAQRVALFGLTEGGQVLAWINEKRELSTSLS
jgi:hypothetical protein